MARALDVLFGHHTAGADTGKSDGRDPEVEGEPVPGERAREPAATAKVLADGVRDVLAGREEASACVRDAARRLTLVGHVEPVVDAAVCLVSSSSREAPDEEAWTLARQLASADVTRRLAARLGAIREPGRRAELATAIGRLGPAMAEALGEALARTEDRGARFALTSALVRVGEDGADVLASLARDRRWFVVRNAVLVLGETRAQWALAHLTRTLAHPDARVRRETLMALARVGGDEAAKLVCGMVSDPDPRVRETAALASGTLRGAVAVEPLLRTLAQGDERVVEMAILRALGQLGDNRAVPALERKAEGSFLSRPPTEVRIAAYRALAAIDTPGARDVLRGGLRDRDPEVRAMAVQLMRTR